MKRNNPFIQASINDYVLYINKYDKYELEYYVFKSTSEPVLFVWDNTLKGYNKAGFVYRLDWDVSDIKEDFLPTIDEVVKRGWDCEVLGNVLMNAIIEPEITYFTSNKNLDEGIIEAKKDERMHMSTKDFKAVTEKWLEFLEDLEGEKTES